MPEPSVVFIFQQFMKSIISVLVFALLFASSTHSAELPKGATSHFEQVNGIKMHYVKMGEGPPLIMLHGWPQTWYEWRHVMPRLSSSYTVIALDLRGCGETERTETGYDKRTIAEDIAALIRHLGSAKAVVVGHDMGGKAAYVLGLVNPELVEKLVLVDCSPPGRENMDSAKGGLWHYGFHMAKDFPEMLTQGKEREYITAQIQHGLHRKDAISADDVEEFTRHYATPGGMTAGFNYYRALLEDAKFVASLPAPKFAMPVLAVGGRHSGADKLYKILIPQASDLTGAIAENSGHFVAEEEPDFFIEQVKSFLNK